MAMPRLLRLLWGKRSLLSSWTWLILAWALLSWGLWLSQRNAGAWVQAPRMGLLDWQPGLWQSQPWRLWTAALVHWSGAHLLLNLLACAALVAWGNAVGVGARQTLAWLLAWPLAQLLLATTPSLPRYGGLSGLLHAGVAIGAWALVWQGPTRRRLVGAAVLVGLAIKLAFEVPLLGRDVPALPLPDAPGFVVANYAHFTGTVAGLVCASALHLALRLGPQRARG